MSRSCESRAEQPVCFRVIRVAGFSSVRIATKASNHYPALICSTDADSGVYKSVERLSWAVLWGRSTTLPSPSPGRTTMTRTIILSATSFLTLSIAAQGTFAQRTTPATQRAAPAVPKVPMMASVDSALFRGLTYRLLGHSRGGRVTTVTGVPSQPRTFYMGVASGGATPSWPLAWVREWKAVAGISLAAGSSFLVGGTVRSSRRAIPIAVRGPSVTGPPAPTDGP